MAPLRTPQAARVRLSAVLQQALGAHDQWLFDLQGWQDRAQAARRARTSFNAPKPRVPPPLLIQASTGLGKSYQIAQIAAQRQTPLLFLTATKDLRDAFVAAVGQAGGQAQAYSGRAHAPDSRITASVSRTGAVWLNRPVFRGGWLVYSPVNK
ncbi:MAG: hypothetical protein B7X31_15750 [Thiomonas sp. 13-66-29]|nr:MAG: hypothetical protein B7X31_15750 [Thiomonas sp. 13-66-29]